jgi:broad specificity phosphatase PhoE
MRTFALVAALLGFGTGVPLPAPTAPATVVILVRHGEKGTQPPQDPPLSEQGQARAMALVNVARQAGVTAIVTTQFERTRKTAEPTAIELKVTPESVQAGGAAHAKAVAEQVMKHAGGTVLVVGHSNTIPAIVGALGAPQPKELCDSEYDLVFTVVLGDGAPPRLIRSRYGAPNVGDATCNSMSR